MDNLIHYRKDMTFLVILSLMISCDPYPDPSIAIKEKLLGKWDWKRSISFDSLDEQTPSTSGQTSTYLFYDNDMVESFLNDTLINTKPYSVFVQPAASPTFKLKMGDYTYNANFNTDTLVWSNSDYYHYFTRN